MGKSKLAKRVCNQHIEADMFFMKDGEYKFDPTKLKQAPLINFITYYN